MSNRLSYLALWMGSAALHDLTHGFTREAWGVSCVLWGLSWLFACVRDVSGWLEAKR